ncbi:MAG: hypothetical protein ACYTGN_03585 [Planctomycetota bacterium]
MVRSLLLVALLAGPAVCGETRLGNLIRFYLAEKRPARQFELVEKIRELTKGDVQAVMRSIENGEHCVFDKAPGFASGGAVPVFSLDRPRLVDVSRCAADFAELALPDGYDPAILYPLVIDLGLTRLPVPKDAVFVRVHWQRHPQAGEALATEGLVLSLLAHTIATCRIDADRVVLRANGKRTAPMAWYIALHNPDRFAGLLPADGFWTGAERLEWNADYFHILAVDRRTGDPWAQRFFGKKGNPIHRLLPAPRSAAADHRTLLPPIEKWQTAVRRSPPPRRMAFKAGRPTATRCNWIRIAPRRRTIRKGKVGGTFAGRSLQFPGALTCRFDQKDRNLLHVQTYRVTAFRVYVDPRFFDPGTLRVKINGGVPIANLIDHNLDVEKVLLDYRERRDPKRLYAASFNFSVRREPASPPDKSGSPPSRKK